MRYDPHHKAQTRVRLLKEAAAAIRADGFERIGIAALMSRAGMTHGGFYAHFASKDDLLVETVDYMFTDASSMLFADVGRGKPRESLSRFVDFYLSMAHRNVRELGCPVPILAGEAHRLPERARVRFAAAVDEMISRIAGLLDSAGIEDARERAGSALTEMVGAIALARVSAGNGVPEELLAMARRSVRHKLDLTDAADCRTDRPAN